MKIDAEGNKTWEKSFGGSSNNILHSLQQTADGGYVLGGYSSSGVSGNKSSPTYGGLDFWVVKVDDAGEKVWDFTFGGNANDVLNTLQQTSDGGYILGGNSYSSASGNKSSPVCCGFDDFCVVKLDSAGNKLWDKSFGGGSSDILYRLHQLSDGRYLLAGISRSTGLGGYDYWIMRMESNGDRIFNDLSKAFGGYEDDVLRILRPTSNGGYILGGSSDSKTSPNKISPSFGNNDYWVVQTDSNGDKMWENSFGGSGVDDLYSLQQTSDGGYILGGQSSSNVSGNKTNASHGGNDYWIVKLQPADLGSAVTKTKSSKAVKSGP